MAEFQIAGLEPVKRKKGWFELDIKGKSPFLIDEEIVFRHSLRAGEILTDSLIEVIKREADLAWLKYRAGQILSSRMISERDLSRKLAAERRPSLARDEAISYLKRIGYVDDLKYAAAYIRYQMSRGAKSRLYLKKKLWEKGIDGETAARAMETELSDFDDGSAIRELALKKFKTLKHLPDEKAKVRLVNFLKGRGFSWGVIGPVIADIIEGDRKDI